jgi:RsiW-degrading membrane proteinase PrsW (M82 family)
MPDHACCVCSQPASSSIGSRWFCGKHHQSATRERPHTWRLSFLLVLGLVTFVGLVYLLDLLLHPALTGTPLILAGVLLALVPAFLWMVFFYLQDRIEPEPKSYILGVFLLGALLASAVGIPVVEDLFHVSKWIYTDTATTLLGSILVVGFIQEFLKYAAVRYSVYSSAEFDEATDGVIYATAAGLGYATVLNLQFVIANGGVALGSSVIRMVVVALAQASFAGITGYFRARARFCGERLVQLAARAHRPNRHQSHRPLHQSLAGPAAGCCCGPGHAGTHSLADPPQYPHGAGCKVGA